jgi:DNA repair protein RecO (recombination protein O)
VLHRWDWSESSLIVDLFTRERGRVLVAAKGAKRPTSQLRPVLRPFQRIAIALGREATPVEVHNLRSAEWGGGPVTADGEALFGGFYCNELLMRLLARDDPHPTLWDGYAATLPRLGGAGEAPALRAFELLLLREAGLLPDLALVTATHVPLQSEAYYELQPENGIVGAAGTAGLTGRLLRALDDALRSGDDGAVVAACHAAQAALRTMLRRFIAYHLSGQPLRTREVLRDMQSMLR